MKLNIKSFEFRFFGVIGLLVLASVTWQVIGAIDRNRNPIPPLPSQVEQLARSAYQNANRYDYVDMEVGHLGPESIRITVRPLDSSALPDGRHCPNSEAEFWQALDHRHVVVVSVISDSAGRKSLISLQCDHPAFVH